MKKLNIILATAILALTCMSITACDTATGDKPEKDTSTGAASVSEEVQTEPSEDEEQYGIGDTGTLKDWNITVTDCSVSESIDNGYGAFNPGEGNKYVRVFATVENTGKQADSFLPTVSLGNAVGAKLLYGDGYEFSSSNLLAYDADLHDSHVNPLASASGEIAFAVPVNVADSDEPLVINFSSGSKSLQFKVR